MKISEPSPKNIKSLMLKANKLTAKSSKVSTARKFEVPKKMARIIQGVCRSPKKQKKIKKKKRKTRQKRANVQRVSATKTAKPQNPLTLL